jgi:quercetin dioxygenase-like cupin family protein
MARSVNTALRIGGIGSHCFGTELYVMRLCSNHHTKLVALDLPLWFVVFNVRSDPRSETYADRGSCVAIRHARSGEIVDLTPLKDRLGDFKTFAIVKTDSFEAVRLIIPAGHEIPPHAVPGPILLQAIEGRVLLGAGETSQELAAGEWLYLDAGIRHWLTGIENASLLLIILPGR